MALWAERSAAEVQTWPDLNPAGKTQRALQVIHGALEGHRALPAAPPGR
jgi:hypothetical protein